MGFAESMGRIVALLILVLWLRPGSLSAETFEDGLHAFRSGQAEIARDIWLPMAETGHAAAQYSLGKLYEQGEGAVAQDYGAAVRWYEAAAEQGLPAALNNLGLMYAKGRGVAQDASRALGLWLTAARLDYPWAQYNLGLAYFQGKGTKGNEQAALAWFRRAADSGLAEAQFIMGLLYRDGLIVQEDRGRALTWYQYAADQGHLRARQQVRHLQALQLEPAPVGEPEVLPQSLVGEGSSDSVLLTANAALSDSQSEKPATPASDTAWSPPPATAEGKVSRRTLPPAKAKPVPVAPRKVVETAPSAPTAEQMAKPAEAAAAPRPQAAAAAAAAEAPVKQVAAAAPAEAAPAPTQAPAPAIPSLARMSLQLPEPTVPKDGAPTPAEAAPQPMTKPVAALAAKAPPAPAESQVAALASDDRTKDAAPPALAPALKTEGAFRVWLASAGSEGEAAALWQRTLQQHPKLLARTDAAFSLVELGGGQTLYRILAGPLASSAAALQLCQQLRVERPGAFCQVRPD